MFKGKSVSVVIPAYNEENGIGQTVEDFKLPYVDEVVVVDNNSSDDTSEVAKKSGARVVHESQQGYGHAVRRALSEATGDYVVLTEADRTFIGADLPKMLKLAAKHHMVIGTRTTTPFLAKGANMGVFLVAGNIFIAKILAILYRLPQLTDVGCTYRLIHRSALKRILPYLKEQGAPLSPEIIVELCKIKATIKEIPVAYLERVGESKITVDKKKAFLNGLHMIRVVLTRILPIHRHP